MFLTVKRKSIAIALLIVVGIAGVSFLISGVSSSAYNVPKVGKTVVIDAGHGGRDGGMTGVNTGIKESELNLAIAKKLKHYLQSGGYDVVMTRNSEDGLYGLVSKNKKLDDLEKRRQIIEKAQPDLMISIHQNSYPRGIVRGAQAFYAPSSETGRNMAGIMQDALNKSLEATSKKCAKGDYYILQCSTYPSLLVECGFLSNSEDEALLVTAAYQEKVAYTLFSGINLILFGDETSGGDQG